MNPHGQITQLLQRVHQGDRDALNTVTPLVYTELKKLAAGHLRREARPNPIDTTALVHEAFVRLLQGQVPSFENRSHFYGIASRLMRQILVGIARAQTAQKRDAKAEMPLADIPDVGRRPDRFVLAINDALDRLAQTDGVRAQLIEMRFFGGMTAEESAAALSLSVHAVRRELRLAQAWLRKELAE